MLGVAEAGCLQHVECTRSIDIVECRGVFLRYGCTGYCRKMYDGIKAIFVAQAEHLLTIKYIEFDKIKLGYCAAHRAGICNCLGVNAQEREPDFFESYGVRFAKIVDTHHTMSFIDEAIDGVETDKAGSTGYEKFHLTRYVSD